MPTKTRGYHAVRSTAGGENFDGALYSVALRLVAETRLPAVVPATSYHGVTSMAAFGFLPGLAGFPTPAGVRVYGALPSVGGGAVIGEGPAVLHGLSSSPSHRCRSGGAPFVLFPGAPPSRCGRRSLRTRRG